MNQADITGQAQCKGCLPAVSSSCSNPPPGGPLALFIRISTGPSSAAQGLGW